MGSLELLFICTSSFISVFVLLALLALVMKIIILLFPEKLARADTAVLAAVASVVSAVYPGTKITKVEEIQ